MLFSPFNAEVIMQSSISMKSSSDEKEKKKIMQ